MGPLEVLYVLIGGEVMAGETGTACGGTVIAEKKCSLTLSKIENICFSY